MKSYIRKWQAIIFCTFNLLITFISIIALRSDYIPQWMPGLSALIIAGILYRKKGVIGMFKRLQPCRVNLKWNAIALIIPIVTTAIVCLYLYSIVPIPYNEIISNEYVFTDYAFILVYILIGSLGEEIGWRGYLLPNLLKRFSLLKSSVIVGLVWGLWHFRIEFGLLSFAVYLLFAIETSIVLTWLYCKTNGNIITSILYHTSINMTAVFLEQLLLGTDAERNQLLFFVLFCITLLMLCIPIVYLSFKRGHFTTDD